MILRVPDYYEEFHCIADRCADSCCIGWEIDIDQDTYEFYRGVGGEMGQRLALHMYDTEDDEHSFRLAEHGRCPFLNASNLCDICIQLGEEALSEVCTEYPRFSLYCENVLQKCLSLSCEEVGRILFSRTEPVKIVDYEMSMDPYEDEAAEPDEDGIAEPDEVGTEASDEDESFPGRELAHAQDGVIAILQQRSMPIAWRIRQALAYAGKVQNWLCEERGSACPKWDDSYEYEVSPAIEKMLQDSYGQYEFRFEVFDQMEVLGEEWSRQKVLLQNTYTNQNYETMVQQYRDSGDYRENDYEQLMVYFVFRYAMNSCWDYNFYSKIVMATEFTLMLRDMDALRFFENGGHFALSDRIDLARIFSKEVEHSQENVALAEEEFSFSLP